MKSNQTNSHLKTYQKLLKTTKYLNLATVNLKSKDQIEPQVATMQFVVDKDNNIYFKSFNSSRKKHNLKQNKKIGIDIHNQTTNEYAQIQANTILINNQKQITKIKSFFKEKFPNINLDYLNHKDIEFFQATPYWIRLRKKATFPFEFKIILEK